ncbi:MAG: hypothetical protein ABSG37_00030 [Candidatus Limnocylindrales bacterium]|jgi:hypothetical protein
MNSYLITVDNRPGVLAELLEAAARRHVNVAPAYGLSDGARGLIALGSDDEAGLRAAIDDAGYTATAIEMVVVELENRPGTGAEVTRKLAAAGVDLHIAVPVGMSGDRVQMGFGASDAALLKRTLGV